VSSPKRASPLALKLFGGPGEPNAGLGELGPRENKEKTLLTFFLGIFCLPDRNTEWFLALHCNWRSTP